MKRIRKQIKNTFDHIPHKSRSETLASLGIVREPVRHAFGKRRLVWVAACIAALCALGTSFALAVDDPSIITKLLSMIDQTESLEISAESSVPTVESPMTSPVILSASSSFTGELAKPVTGRFDTLTQAMQAVETEYEFYYPTWDGGFADLFGKDCPLIVLLGTNSVALPPTYETTQSYLSLQFNYHTELIDYFKVILGRRESVPGQYEEVYTFEYGTFYLCEPTYAAHEGKVLAVGSIGQCGYTILASNAEAAKRMIDSLVTKSA